MCSRNLSKRKLIQLTSQECRAKIVKYNPKVKKIKRGRGTIIVPSLIGIRAKKEGYIHPMNRCGQIQKYAMKIPKNMKKGKVSSKTKTLYSDHIPDIKKEARCAKKAVKVEEWIKKTTRKHHLTIQQVQRMKKGEKMKVLVLDRNVGDTIDGQPLTKVMAPTTFFNMCWAVYTHDHDMTGTIKYAFQSKSDKPFPFTFDLNYKSENWYPLDKDGNLPAKDPQGFAKLFQKKISYKIFPKKTRVGWRGPMIPWSKLSSLPKVFRCQFCGNFGQYYNF